MTKTGLQNIFSIPIFTTILDNSIIKNIEDLIIPRLSKLTRNQEHSTDFYNKEKIISSNEIPELFNIIDYHCNEFCQKTNLFKSNNISCWVQDYDPNDSHTLHSHGYSYISGVYYIRADRNSGRLRISNPNPYIIGSEFTDGFEKHQYYDISPQKGLLVLFPSYLVHQVLPSNTPNVKRTCIAFNYE